MFNIPTWVFWKQTQSICKRYPYLEAVVQSGPLAHAWPDQLYIVDWRLSAYFPPPVTRVSSPLRRASPQSPAPAVLHSDGSDTKEVLGSAKVDHGSDVGQRPSYRSLAYPSFFKAKG